MPCLARDKVNVLYAKGAAKAIQGGSDYQEISHAIDSCFLCGACETACPEGIGLADLNIHQRQELNRQRTEYPDWYPAENTGKNSIGKKS